MSKSKYRPKWHSMSQDSKEDRKLYQRKYRQKVRILILMEKYDEILPFQRTSGWLTW